MSEISLSAVEQEIALAETQAVLTAAVRPEYRQELALLATAIGEGRLEAEHALTLERIVELALQTGRVRAVYGPPGEQTALRLYRRLPRGAALTESAREVSAALGSLRGRTLEGATLTAVGPGSYTLSLATGEARLSVRLDRHGARLTSVEV
jgi:hypothetical protein